MRAGRRSVAALLGLTLLIVASGQATAGVGEACRDQAASAERGAAIPEGLLLAIGKRESGRYDTRAGGVLPWPWAVNREGEGHLFETREEAIAYVAAALRAGATSIDVGCFQINLKYHPTAFASLDEAFDPAANAAYAARFMTELHDRTGNWETAIAYYHSADPLLGEPYRRAVLATWHGETEFMSGGQAGLTLSGPLREIMGIRIWIPSASVASVSGPATRQRALPAAPRVVSLHPDPLRSGRTLPRVFTPSAVVAQSHG